MVFLKDAGGYKGSGGRSKGFGSGGVGGRGTGTRDGANFAIGLVNVPKEWRGGP